MKLADLNRTPDGDERRRTLVLCAKADRVLLAMKKRGFGEGWWNGYGGKLDPGETLEQAAVRELEEESGLRVSPNNLSLAGIIDFFFAHQAKDDQRVFVYLVTAWDGEPEETEEMRPQWFLLNQLPLERMWPADRVWIPQILQGARLKGRVLFGDDMSVSDQEYLPMT
jgi:8-oxo-dGTP diphosphatase